MKRDHDTIRVGSGAGFSADRIDPALKLIEHAGLDWIGFECLAERTLALAQVARDADPAMGHDRFLEARLDACLPALAANKVRMITNMGAANPAAAAALAAAKGAHVAWIEGDDVRHLLDEDTRLGDIDATIGEVGAPLISANAYLGAEQILPAIETGADIIITGRVADPALFLSPVIHAFGWALDDWPRLGAGTLAGHLLECAGQVTGGYFSDPPVKTGPGLDAAGMADLGFPFADIAPDGSFVIAKRPEDGGAVDLRTVKEQILYEVHDPSSYLTPDVTADFSGARLEELGPDRVRVSGGSGTARPQTLKVTAAFDGGLVAEAGISYAGLGAGDRARLAADILRLRLRDITDLRIDLIGLASLHASHAQSADLSARASAEARDVRVHVAARVKDQRTAERVLWEVEALYTNGPAAGGGVRGQVRRSFFTHDVYLPREMISLETGELRP